MENNDGKAREKIRITAVKVKDGGWSNTMETVRFHIKIYQNEAKSVKNPTISGADVPGGRPLPALPSRSIPDVTPR
jgi:hypothetical protein